MTRCLVLLFILLIVALPASAGWDNDHNGTGDACETVQPNPTQQRRCWFNFTNATGTGNSNMLRIDQCENYSVAFTPDFDGSDTTATVRFYVCLDDTDTNACYLLENTTLDGDASTKTEVVYGADGTWGYLDIVTGAADGANARAEFRCNQ
jgi:hypothetical protein